MNVQMPDGTVISNVPEGTTRSELLRRYGLTQEPSALDRVGNMLTGEGGSIPASPTELSQQANDPTGLQRGTGALIENLPLIAGTAASIAAPPLALPAWALRLGMAGKAAAPFIRGAPAIAAAGGGGAVGGGTQAALQDGDIPQSALTGAGEMAAGQTLGTGVVAGLGKLLKPFLGGTGKLPHLANEIDLSSKGRNIPLSPGVINPSLLSKAIEGGTDAFLPSRLVNEHYRKAAIVQFNNLMTEIPKEVGPLKGNEIVSQEALDAFRNVYVQKEKAAKQLSQEFLAPIGWDAEVLLKKTKEVLSTIKDTAIDDKLLRFAQQKLASIGENDTYRADKLETMMRQISSIKPIGDSKFLPKLRDAIKSDFEKAGADITKLNEGNELFKQNIGLLAGKTAKELKAAAMKGFTPQALTVKIFRNGNEAFVQNLAKELPGETWDSLRAQNLANMIENASTPSKRLMGLKIINGDKLEKILTSNKSVLSVAYRDKEDTIDAMHNLAMLAKAAEAGSAKYESGISLDIKQLNIGGLAAGGFMTGLAHAPALIIGSAGSALLAKSLMNPNGIMKQWLTTGFKLPGAAKEGLKLGGRAVFSDSDQNSSPAN